MVSPELPLCNIYAYKPGIPPGAPGDIYADKPDIPPYTPGDIYADKPDAPLCVLCDIYADKPADKPSIWLSISSLIIFSYLL